jgi:hypothetical protein
MEIQRSVGAANGGRLTPLIRAAEGRRASVRVIAIGTPASRELFRAGNQATQHLAKAGESSFELVAIVHYLLLF